MKKHLSLHIISAFLLMVVFIAVLLFGGVGVTYAATSNYSNVLDDLRKDENFDFNDYPNVDDDYSLQVIQIAESTDRELYLYVYQPAAAQIELKATSVNISTVINDNLKYKNYTLTLLSSSGVFSKYLVNDLALKIDTVRYYDISSIYRSFNPLIDEPAEGGNIVNEVVYEVGQLWTACTLNDTVTYEVLTSETIVVTDKYVGFVRYPDGHDFWGSYFQSCDSHYIAFSTDKQIDKLLQADVYFITQSSDYYFGIGTSTDGRTTLGDKVDKYVTLNYSDVVSNSGDKWLGKKYTWNRIETVADFMNKEDLEYDALSDLNGKQWVLRFYESEYKYQTSGSAASGTFSYHKYSTLVSEVTILRLKFETEGEVFNLGVIDNKQTGDGIADNKAPAPNFFKVLLSWFNTFGNWLADFLRIPSWLGKVFFAIILAIPVLFVVSIIVTLVRKIRGDK